MKSRTAVALLLLVLAAGCGRGHGDGALAGAGSEAEHGYLRPPELKGVAAAGAAGSTLTGLGSPGAEIRLDSTRGEVILSKADASGDWSVPLPPAASARLFNLSMTDEGRVVQAQGYLLLLPDGKAARLRAGGGTELLNGAADTVRVETLDYDGEFGAIVAGRAHAGETVSLRVDGVQRARAVADASGRYAAALNFPLSRGAHDFDVAATGEEAHLPLPISTPAALGGARFSALATTFGWRVDWLTPGGGEQTTLIIETSEPRR